jgi:exopolyphosphatase/guanosine-5'-triphosphate,3'-diphosphate pyrophosphatase
METGKLMILFFAFVVSSALHANECEVVRAALDIGSGTTKVKVAKVDKCKQKIVEMLLEDQMPVAYKEDLKLSENNSFSKSIIDKGKEVLKTLLDRAKNHAPNEFYGVATSAFRTAKNGKDSIKSLAKVTNFELKVITQETEAKLGFAAASTIADNSMDKIVVWDIGGGSMQMISYNGNGDFSIFKGNVASVSFKNYVLESIQKKSVDETPNPMSKGEKYLAVRDAGIYAKMTVNQDIQAKLKDANTQVLGIGGVHYYAVGKLINNEESTFTFSEVDAKLDERFAMSDEQIGGDYAATANTNLALVSGFMQSLNIPKVKYGKINLADGLLIAPEFSQ